MTGSDEKEIGAHTVREAIDAGRVLAYWLAENTRSPLVGVLALAVARECILQSMGRDREALEGVASGFRVESRCPRPSDATG